jgi:AraC-like DNA-binding protein
MDKRSPRPNQLAGQQIREQPRGDLPGRSESAIQRHDAALMGGIQRVRADLSRNADGDQMFDDVRELSFDDSEYGWLETTVAKLGPSQIGLWRVRSTGHRISVGVPSQATLLLPLSGSVYVETGGGEFNATAGEALMIGSGPRKTRTNSLARKPYDALALMFPPDLASVAAPSARGFLLPGRGGLASYVRYLAAEAQAVDGILLRPATQQAVAATLADYLATLMDVRQDASAVRVAASLRQMNRAEEIMREDFQEPLTISTIAQQIGVSARSLQHAFRVHRNAGPLEMLNRIRLENARLRLLNAQPSDTVSSIALDCGFSHLGRFSIVYRESYGETPSETLRRRRMRD